MAYFVHKPLMMAMAVALTLHAIALWALHTGVRWRTAAPERADTVARLIVPPVPKPKPVTPLMPLEQPQPARASAAPAQASKARADRKPAPPPAAPLLVGERPAKAPVSVQATPSVQAQPAPLVPQTAQPGTQPSTPNAPSATLPTAAPATQALGQSTSPSTAHSAAAGAPQAASRTPVATPALATYQAQPVITPLMERLGQAQGDVTLRLLIGNTGDVLQAQTVHPSPHDRLNQAVLAAAKKSRYTPATCDGQSVPSWWRITYRVGFKGEPGEPSGTVDCKNLPPQ